MKLMTMLFRTRFAPSPTGLLHLGHAYSALLAHDRARAEAGEFLLRIEDLDPARCRDHFEAQIYEDLDWLGIRWDGPVLRQSEQTQDYDMVLSDLMARGLTFACSCSRGDIRAALAAPQEGAIQHGPDGLIYPGTCRGRVAQSQAADEALRLDMTKSTAALPDILCYQELGEDGPSTIKVISQSLVASVGDVVLGRKGQDAVAYHLACVIDDARQGISHVIRGQDLSEATQIHVVLQKLLGLQTPVYCHHRLIRDETGKRLAKRSDAQAIAKLRDDGMSPQDIRRLVGL
jgi:glutamyl-Q tRNA(Asp) synthetase